MRKRTKAKPDSNFRNIFLLFLVILIVAVSGCISGGSKVSVGGNGIVITDFASSVSDVSDCDKTVRLSLDVENAGGKSIPAGGLMACINGKNFPGKTSEQMWAIDSLQTNKICQVSTKRLDAPDLTRNIPGGAASFKWTANSPFVPFPLTRTDGFDARVFYNYSSRTSATVFVVSEDELAVATQTGKALPSSPDIDKVPSPVDINIDVSQPIVGEQGDTFTIKVTLSNVGGGTVFDENAITFSDRRQVPAIAEDKLNLITIKIDTSLDAGGTNEAGFCRDELRNVELRKGSTVTIPCDIRINTPITKLQSFPILLTASYGYFIDSSEVPIRVTGKKNKEAFSCLKGVSSGTSSSGGTGADTTSPAITSRVPSPGETGFSRNGNIIITFSEPMNQDATKAAINIFEVRNGVIDNTPRDVTKTFSSDGAVLTLDPVQTLGGNNQFAVVVSSGAKDLAGNALASDLWTFRTAN